MGVVEIRKWEYCHMCESRTVSIWKHSRRMWSEMSSKAARLILRSRIQNFPGWQMHAGGVLGLWIEPGFRKLEKKGFEIGDSKK